MSADCLLHLEPIDRNISIDTCTVYDTNTSICRYLHGVRPVAEEVRNENNIPTALHAFQRLA
jgi:hypothetical protein